MSKAEEILDKVFNKPEHRMADYPDDHTKDAIIDCINTALSEK